MDAFDPKDFETKLSSDQEKQFWPWLSHQHQAGAIHDGDYNYYQQNGYGYDYDFRAAFQNGSSASEEDGHWDDLGKKPNHPTFSTFSKYANTPGSRPGTWDGNMYVPGGQVGGAIGQEYNPPQSYNPPSISDTPMFHNGQPVDIRQPKNQLLFKFLKGLNDTRLQLLRQRVEE